MKNHFDELNELHRKIKETQLKLATIESELYSVRSVNYDFMAKANGFNDNLVYKSDKKDELQRQLDSLRTSLKFLERKHLQEIALVNDERLRSILRSCYVYKLSNETVANLINVSLSRFFTLKKIAVKEFKRANNLN